MKSKLSNKASDIFITIYILLTLTGRIYIEPLLKGYFLISLFIGIAALLIIWILVKIKFLNPSFFGSVNNIKN